MQFRLIQYGSDHYKQAKQLRNAVLRLPLRLVLTQEDVDGEDKQLHFVALDGDLVVGAVTFKPLSKTQIQLRQMAVSPALQGKGVGQQLVAYAEKAVKSAGFTKAVTKSRVNAENFYARMGYQSEGLPFISNTLPHVMMSKSL